MSPDERVPRLAAGCRLRTVSPEETLLLVPEGALRLKGSGREIVALVDGNRTISEIASQLQQTHSENDADRISAEVRGFLDRLNARSVVLYRETSLAESGTR